MLLLQVSSKDFFMGLALVHFKKYWFYTSYCNIFFSPAHHRGELCSSNIPLSLPSYTGSALKRELNFCNGYLSLLYFWFGSKRSAVGFWQNISNQQSPKPQWLQFMIESSFVLMYCNYTAVKSNQASPRWWVLIYIGFHRLIICLIVIHLMDLIGTNPVKVHLHKMKNTSA